MEKLSYDELRELQFLVWAEMTRIRKFSEPVLGYSNLLDQADSCESKLNEFALIDSKLHKLRSESLRND
ncbi:hypothetical protein ACT54M_00005, partial [Leptospira santarosai]|uniref:hypothetical protein n=1 Tax=Leptospira santarosai TaxID=28183 RepID=UPI004035E8CF